MFPTEKLSSKRKKDDKKEDRSQTIVCWFLGNIYEQYSEEMFSSGSHITEYRDKAEMGKQMELALQRGILTPDESKVISSFPSRTYIKLLTKNNLVP